MGDEFFALFGRAHDRPPMGAGSGRVGPTGSSRRRDPMVASRGLVGKPETRLLAVCGSGEIPLNYRG